MCRRQVRFSKRYNFFTRLLQCPYDFPLHLSHTQYIRDGAFLARGQPGYSGNYVDGKAPGRLQRNVGKPLAGHDAIVVRMQ